MTKMVYGGFTITIQGGLDENDQLKYRYQVTRLKPKLTHVTGDLIHDTEGKAYSEATAFVDGLQEGRHTP